MGWLLSLFLFRIILCLHLLLFYFPSFSSSYSYSYSYSLAPLCHPHQSSALLQFKSSFTVNTSGDASYYCNRPYPKTTSWENGTDCCSWHGVTCDTVSSHVIGLDLSCSWLQGKIHPNSSLFRLTHLQTLNLARNDFSESQLQSQFGGFVSLTHLNLSDSVFEGDIPPEISHLSKLESLDLSMNFHLKVKQTTWKRLVQNATVLRELVLDDTDMSSISPESLSLLLNLSSSLVTLGLASAQLSGQIPDVFGGLTKLETLNLGDNNLRGQLPSSLFNLTQLSYLDCSFNKLEGPLPNKITGLSNLTELSLGDNLLNGTIPSWCLSLPSLTDLSLSHNQFTGHIGAVSSYSLEYLYLRGNKLEGNIPQSIFNLGNLTLLDLSSNSLSGPVNFQLFSELQNLKILSLSDNNRLSINFKSNVNYSFPRLQVLQLASNNLTEFPRQSGKFPKLSVLNLSNNKLHAKVPNWLCEMDSLVFLNLSQKLFTSVDEFSSNCKLRYLDLSFNLLAGDVSSSICNASSLLVLNLSHNNLTGIIPRCLANLSSLQVLDLQMNKLYGTLPSAFAKYLVNLSLNDNQLQGTLPKSLSSCKQLQVLNLGNNQIEDTFPHWLHTLSDLKVLVLRANKFHGPIASLKTNHIFSNLIIFYISCNNFSGPLPTAYIKKFEAMKNSIELGSSLQYLAPYLQAIYEFELNGQILLILWL